jgi:hypothetical protein
MLCLGQGEARGRVQSALALCSDTPHPPWSTSLGPPLGSGTLSLGWWSGLERHAAHAAWRTHGVPAADIHTLRAAKRAWLRSATGTGGGGCPDLANTVAARPSSAALPIHHLIAPSSGVWMTHLAAIKR